MVRLEEEAGGERPDEVGAEAPSKPEDAVAVSPDADGDEPEATERAASEPGDGGGEASEPGDGGGEPPEPSDAEAEVEAEASEPEAPTPVIELPERPPQHQVKGGARVVVTNLTKAFRHGGRRLEVLHSVSFVLEPGEMVAIVGKSGVGKSTLLHVLGTLDLPTSGSLEINGEEITRMGPARLAEFRNREIGFVFQFHHLLPEFTALENVMMPCMINRLSRRTAHDAARDVLEAVGLGKRLTHKPGELSGGEQQRVALARAMVMRPSLLLADEPTGNLDSNTGAAIHDLFLRLNEERGSTTLIVTHNPELAALMPRCLRMVDGGLEDERA